MFLSITSFFILLIWVILSKKRLSKLEILSTLLFAVILAFTTDNILAIKYHLYGYFGPEDVAYKDFIITLGLYPVINILFLNYYPLKKPFMLQVIYLLIWSFFALGYEWLAVQTGLFYHSGWKFWYSVPSYPLLFLILLGNLRFIRWLK